MRTDRHRLLHVRIIWRKVLWLIDESVAEARRFLHVSKGCGEEVTGWDTQRPPTPIQADCQVPVWTLGPELDRQERDLDVA